MAKQLSSRSVKEEGFSVEHIQDVIFVLHEALDLDLDVEKYDTIEAAMDEMDVAVVQLGIDHQHLKADYQKVMVDRFVLDARLQLLTKEFHHVMSCIEELATRSTHEGLIALAVDRLKSEGKPEISMEPDDGGFVSVSYKFTAENLHEALKDAIETYNIELLNSVV